MVIHPIYSNQHLDVVLFISIDGSVLVAAAGVSKGGGCIEFFAGGWFTGLVFVIGRGVAGPSCI